MILKCNSRFGQFAFAVEAEVSEEQRDALAAAGLLQILQRSPATAAEKEMGWNGAKERPKDFKRDEAIPFSDAGCATLKKHLEAAVLEYDKNGVEVKESLAIDASVTQHVGSKSEPKWKAEKEVWGRHATAGTLASLAAKVGYAGEHREGEEAAVAFLAAIKAFTQEAVRKALA